MSMPQKKLTETLFCRVPKGFKRRFHNKASQFGTPSEIHREILAAFLEDRLSISPDPNKPTKENLYES